MTNLDSIFKSRNITLPTKVCLVKVMVFPVVMYGCESWTVKKAEHWRIDAFELWCWRRLLRVPWTARRSNQSILKEISPGCSLEGMMLTLKLQYFGHLMRRVHSLGEWDDRGWDGWMASLTRWTWVWVNSGSLWWTGRPGVLRFMGLQRIGHDWAPELNRTDFSLMYYNRFYSNDWNKDSVLKPNNVGNAEYFWKKLNIFHHTRKKRVSQGSVMWTFYTTSRVYKRKRVYKRYIPFIYKGYPFYT